ncbi:hypothetical protein C9I98_08140 [Photobacterium sanctipauli]|uniref:Uncharacterized protein n=2 Tax=Photobacterium sanctipauli TaxID=1342794 RepID=A0A2T3NX72_9GAMM|nr:hypothetical protein C9I98_08140 [Photobacterium sanctipauli]
MVTTGTNEERMATFMPYKDFPMGANIAWQLFKNSDDKYAVRMLHNERIVNFQIDGCMDTELCEWDKVNEFYAQPEYSVMPERVPEPGKEKETKKEELVTNF